MNNLKKQSSYDNHRTALITGGTSGIGKSLLPELIRQGFDVYFIGTNTKKGREIEYELNTDGNQRSTFIELDLSNLHKVRDFSRSFLTKVPKLDLLLNVAGVMLPSREVTDEGFEKTFAIDYFSTVVLTQELLPALEAARPSRIVNVAGDPKYILKHRLDFNDLMSEKKYNIFKVALNAVNAKTVYTEILAEQLQPKGIDVNSFHPGKIKGDLGRHAKFPGSLLFKIMKPFYSETCISGIYASTASELTGETGQFIINEGYQPLRFNKDYKDKLWHLTKQLLEPIFSEGKKKH